MAFPKDISAGRMRDWADEHLMYEVTTLLYATVELGNLPGEPSGQENVLLESFAVHARCLDHFLWRGRSDKKRDAFASDFCAPGDWERSRDGLKRDALEKIEKGRRFGREVMHLTYDRIDGAGDKKKWPCGKATLEIAFALERFAPTALPDRLTDETRAFLGGLRALLEPTKTPDLLPERHIGRIVGATAMDPANFRAVTGGTTLFTDIESGG